MINMLRYDTKFKLLVPNGSMDFICQDFCRRVLRTRGYELRGAAAKAVGAETLPLSFRCTETGTERHLQPKPWGFHHSLDWFKGKSTGNHGFFHQIVWAFL